MSHLPSAAVTAVGVCTRRDGFLKRGVRDNYYYYLVQVRRRIIRIRYRVVNSGRENPFLSLHSPSRHSEKRAAPDS